MTVSEAVAHLRNIASDMPLHEQQAVANHLEQIGTRVAEHLGQDHPGAARIQEAVDNAMRLSSDTFGALELLGQTVGEVADGLMQG